MNPGSDVQNVCGITWQNAAISSKQKNNEEEGRIIFICANEAARDIANFYAAIIEIEYRAALRERGPFPSSKIIQVV